MVSLGLSTLASLHPALAHGNHDHSHPPQDSLIVVPGDSLFSGMTTDSDYPKDVTIRATGQRYRLAALGSGVRRGGDEALYEVVLYADASVDLGSETSKKFIGGGFARRVLLHFLRDLSGDELRREFAHALAGIDVSKEEKDSLLSYLDGGVAKGETAEFMWIPALGLHTLIADRWHPTILDKTLADSLFGMWIGTESLSEDLEKDLIRLLAKDR